jgi:hypothetical protein
VSDEIDKKIDAILRRKAVNDRKEETRQQQRLLDEQERDAKIAATRQKLAEVIPLMERNVRMLNEKLHAGGVNLTFEHEQADPPALSEVEISLRLGKAPNPRTLPVTAAIKLEVNALGLVKQLATPGVVPMPSFNLEHFDSESFQERLIAFVDRIVR